MRIIDPHIHLFDLEKGDYQWLRPENPPYWPDKSLIAKSFSEQDLTLKSPVTLAGFVHIEAGFDNAKPWREVEWLEQNCQVLFRSVAMLDITLSPAVFEKQLTKLVHYKSVAAIRYILDDHALVILSNPNSEINLQKIAKQNLSFELQLSIENTQAVDRLIEIISATSGLLYCINHAGFPPLNKSKMLVWMQNIKRLAEFDNIFIKCSGYEMAERNYSIKWCQEVIHHCIVSFGINRVMLASNFPLSLWRNSYQQTWQNYGVLENVSNTQLSDNDLDKLCYKNAYHFYKFN